MAPVMKTKGFVVVAMLGMVWATCAFADDSHERKVLALSCEIKLDASPASKSLKSLLVEVPALLLEEPAKVVKTVEYAKKRGQAQRKLRLELRSYGMSHEEGPKMKALIEHLERGADGRFVSVGFGAGASAKFDLSGDASGLQWGAKSNSAKVLSTTLNCDKVKTSAAEALAGSQSDE